MQSSSVSCVPYQIKGCSTHFHKQDMMVLPRRELIFFIIASMGLRFGFVLKTVLMILGCFCYC